MACILIRLVIVEDRHFCLDVSFYIDRRGLYIGLMQSHSPKYFFHLIIIDRFGSTYVLHFLLYILQLRSIF